METLNLFTQNSHSDSQIEIVRVLSKSIEHKFMKQIGISSFQNTEEDMIGIVEGWVF